MRVLLSAVLLLLSACGLLYKYQEPTDTEVATIGFAANIDRVLAYSVGFFYVQPVDDHSCLLTAPMMAAISEDNPFGGSTSRLKGIRIAAGRAVAIRSNVAISSIPIAHRGCTIDTAFLPIAGENYLLSIRYRDEHCDVELTDSAGTTVDAEYFEAERC